LDVVWRRRLSERGGYELRRADQQLATLRLLAVDETRAEFRGVQAPQRYVFQWHGFWGHRADARSASGNVVAALRLNWSWSRGRLEVPACFDLRWLRLDAEAREFAFEDSSGNRPLLFHWKPNWYPQGAAVEVADDWEARRGLNLALGLGFFVALNDQPLGPATANGAAIAVM
jgi:hypothetical protein